MHRSVCVYYCVFFTNIFIYRPEDCQLDCTGVYTLFPVSWLLSAYNSYPNIISGVREQVDVLGQILDWVLLHPHIIKWSVNTNVSIECPPPYRDPRDARSKQQTPSSARYCFQSILSPSHPVNMLDQHHLPNIILCLRHPCSSASCSIHINKQNGLPSLVIRTHVLACARAFLDFTDTSPSIYLKFLIG